MGHDFKNKNKHIFTSNSEFSFKEIVNNPEMKTKYIYSDEFLNNENDKPIDINKLNITDCYKLEKPLCYHLYNMKQVKSFQNDLPIFYAIYNISAMKMHQLHRKIGGSLVGVFTDTIIVEPKQKNKMSDGSIVDADTIIVEPKRKQNNKQNKTKEIYICDYRTYKSYNKEDGTYKIEKCVNTVQTLSVKKKNHIKDIPLKTVVDIIYEPINKVACNKSIIGGIRETDVKEFTQLTSTDARTTKYKHETIKLNSIDDYDITDGYGYWYVLLTGTTNNKGCFITGEAGTGKTTTANKLKAQLQPNQYKVCTPTHKSSLLYDDAQTVYSLFNINQHNHTYLKSSVDKLKSEGVEYIFIDEVSMINCKVWAVIRDIKKIYGFKFILIGDFHQLDSIESIHYDVINSEVFADICDGQMLELTTNWRAQNDPEFGEFIQDLRIVKDGGHPDFST